MDEIEGLAEDERLSALRRTEILDTAPEEIYDDIAFLAGTVCDAPGALVNLIDADRQWTKAARGVQPQRVARSQSLCAQTIEEPDGILVIPDVAVGSPGSDVPDVAGGDRVHLYGGAAIRDEDGNALGSVCVLDSRTRELSDAQRQALRALARQAAAHLSARAAALHFEQIARELRAQAIRDNLTGVATRAFFLESLTLSLAQRRDARPGVVFCDLDGFKAINDRHGHPAGDNLLQTAAQRIQAAARQGDLIGRYGGDEFLVLCPALQRAADLEAVAHRIRLEVARPTSVNGAQITLTVSAGVALATPDETPESVIERADRAMYAEKRSPSTGRVSPGLPGDRDGGGSADVS